MADEIEGTAMGQQDLAFSRDKERPWKEFLGRIQRLEPDLIIKDGSFSVITVRGHTPAHHVLPVTCSMSLPLWGLCFLICKVGIRMVPISQGKQKAQMT